MNLILVRDSDFLHHGFLMIEPQLSLISKNNCFFLYYHQCLLSRLFQIEATKLLVNIKFTLIEMTNKSTNWCWEKLARKNLIQIFKRGKVVFSYFVPKSSTPPKSKILKEIGSYIGLCPHQYVGPPK